MNYDSPYFGPLVRAVTHGKSDAVREVFAQHPELEHDHETLNNFLRDAAGHDNVDIVALLVEHGADINAPEIDSTNSPEGAIDRAACEGAINVVRWMLQRGAKLNFEVDGIPRCMPLVGAVQSGHLEVVKLLVEHGANINATWAGMTPLGCAMDHEIRTYLRSKGAKLPWELGLLPPVPDVSIVEHYRKHYGESVPLSLGEDVPCDPPITFHRILYPVPVWQVLGTEGMSSLPLATPKGAEGYQFAELIMYLPLSWQLSAEALRDPRWSWPVQWLRRLACEAHGPRTWLAGPMSLIGNGEPPQPLAPNTRLSCLIVMAGDSESGWLARPDGGQVAFLSVFPIYREERELAQRLGPAALLERFRDQDVSVAASIDRPNVAL